MTVVGISVARQKNIYQLISSHKLNIHTYSLQAGLSDTYTYQLTVTEEGPAYGLSGNKCSFVR